MTTAVTTTLVGMALNSWVKVSDSADAGGAGFANDPAFTRTEYDGTGGGAVWTADGSGAGAPGQNPMAGVNGGTMTQRQAYTGAGISDTGLLIFHGGGHAGSGIGSIMSNHIQLLAASYNAASTKKWDYKVASTRWLLQSAGRPSLATSPVGNKQIAPSVGANSYYAAKNRNGESVLIPVHGYNQGTIFYPGTDKAIYGSGKYGFDLNGTSANNSIGVVDFTNYASPVVTGPFTTTLVGGEDNSYGALLPQRSGEVLAAVFDDLTGNLIRIGDFAGYYIVPMTSPLTAPADTDPVGAAVSIDVPTHLVSALLLPDPNDSSKRIIFQHHSPSTATDTGFTVVLARSPWTYFAKTYSSSVATAISGVADCSWWSMSYDSKRGIIWGFDGVDLYKITPAVSAVFAGWTLAKVAGSTGGPPTAPGTLSRIPTSKYIRSEDMVVVSVAGETWFYKPSDWTNQNPGGGSINLPVLGAGAISTAILIDRLKENRKLTRREFSRLVSEYGFAKVLGL
jgi:hypothetical protein